ncbi:hypothetical protein BS78_04G173500 [Paspalum vaginatum]|nr:hypothetical protein BS78_04G173500 [Paspalum vaginatum]
MAKPDGLLYLEGHYASYSAYHSNAVNVGIHELVVWPIFLTAIMLLHLAAPFEHVVLVVQLFCWSKQLVSHGVFEKQTPAPRDNLVQAAPVGTIPSGATVSTAGWAS